MSKTGAASSGGVVTPSIAISGGAERGSRSAVSTFSSKGLARFSPGRSEFSGPKTNRYGSAFTSMKNETSGPRISFDKSAIRASSEKFNGKTSKPDIGMAKMTQLGRLHRGSENAPKTAMRAPMTPDRLAALVRQPDAKVADLQRISPVNRNSQLRIVEKGDVHMGRESKPIQRLWTDAPRRAAMPEVKPLKQPEVKPLTHLPIVENRPNVTSPMPTVPERAVERRAQALVTVREKLKAEQAALVEKIKPTVLPSRPEVRINPAPKLSAKDELATRTVAKVDLRKTEPKKEKTFAGLLREKETAKAFLQQTAEQAQAIIATRDALPKGKELVAVKTNDAIEYRTQDVVSHTVLEEQEDEKKKKMRFGISWQWKLRARQQIKVETVAESLPVMLPQAQEQKVAQAVGLSSAQPETATIEVSAEGEKVQTTLNTTVTNITGEEAVLLTVRQQRVSESAKGTVNNEEEYAIDQETQVNRINAAHDAILAALAQTDEERISGEQIVAALAKPSVETTSGILLEHGIGEAVEAQEQIDPTDEAWREEVASYREMTPMEVKSFVVFSIDSHRAVLRGKGKKASENEVKKVLGNNKSSSHLSRMN
jgi:hypothetical protein